MATIGYEGATIEPFVRALKSARVRRLFDVRELPLSRKKGFSKSALGERLNRDGIDYVHVKALGDPKSGRTAARAGDLKQFKRIYGRHLKTADARQALIYLGEAVLQSKSCLLCFEYDPSDCHRQIVASVVSKAVGIKIEHLFVPQPADRSSDEQKRARRSHRSREGAPAPQHETW